MIIATSQPLACVFGGTGFLGRRVVHHLADSGFRVRVLARNPRDAVFPELSEGGLERVPVDVRDDHAVAAAVEGACAVVDAISLYVEERGLSFHAIHVEGAGRVARLSRAAGVESLAYVSGIGAAPGSPSALIRAKAYGEDIVATEFPGAWLVRPSVMFGRDDAFVRNLELATRLPLVPLFGTGAVRMQPAWVDDVAQALVKLLSGATPDGQVLEFGGACTISYREAIEAVCENLGRKRLLLPLPMHLWKFLVRVMGLLPRPPLTMDQLYLLARDNTVDPARDGFARLGMQPGAFRELLQSCLSRS